jgi:hypothetical protein
MLFNSLTFIKIIIYYLNKDLINKSILINIYKIKNAYTNENIAEIIILMLVKIEIVSHLRYFIGDNVSFNDIC